MGVPPAKTGAWSTGLFNCCAAPGGCGTCCFATCCGCCQYGQNLERMAAGEVCCGANSCGACCCFYMLGGFVPTMTAVIFLLPVPLSCSCFVHTGARGWIRSKYGIPGTCCGDCMITTFCIPCALCQEHRELVIRNLGIGGVEMQKAVPQQPIVIVNNVMAPPPQAYPAPGYPAVVQPPQAYPAPAYPANAVVPAPSPPPEHHEKKHRRSHSSSSSSSSNE